jgi:thiol-disulfide isomerase/thioredoxin
MLVRLLALALLLGVAALAYRWWQGRQGTVRRVERPGALTAATLGGHPGERATFVQFSTPMCAKCPPTATMLKRVAAEQPHVVHLEIDAAERLDLARELNIMRTPTTLILDSDGVVVARMDGAPTESQAREALAAVPPPNEYSI